MLIARRVLTDRLYAGFYYAVEQDGKPVFHIRPYGTAQTMEWRVYRLRRNGMSNAYRSPQKAAQAYGLEIEAWYDAQGQPETGEFPVTPPVSQRETMRRVTSVLNDPSHD